MHLPLRACRHRVSFPGLVVMAAVSLAAGSLSAQQSTPPSTGDQLQPALVSLTQAVRELRIDKWKAPAAVRDDAQRNLNSIERDMDTTLPGLLAATRTESGSGAAIAANFAVYRNLDALYDVVLRVSLTAELAAPDVEVEALDHALAQLESSRKTLAETIQSSVERQQERVVQLEGASRSPASATPAVTPATTMVQDGPQAAKPAKKKKQAPALPQ